MIEVQIFYKQEMAFLILTIIEDIRKEIAKKPYQKLP